MKRESLAEQIFSRSLNAEYGRMLHVDEVRERAAEENEHAEQVVRSHRADETLREQMERIDLRLQEAAADLHRQAILRERSLLCKQQVDQAREKSFRHKLAADAQEAAEATLVQDDDRFLGNAISDQEELFQALTECADYGYPILYMQKVASLCERTAASSKRFVEYFKSNATSSE